MPYGEDTHTLLLTSKLVDLRVGVRSGFGELCSPNHISLGYGVAAVEIL